MQAADLHWIRRRARQWQAGFAMSRTRAVREAAANWWRFKGLSQVLAQQEVK